MSDGKARPMRDIFERIYEDDAWRGGGSGEGSQLVHNRGYVAFLQKFLAERKIRSVVDLGCGDWQFSRTIDWRGIDYRGYDLVRTVIEHNRRKFGGAHISFHLFDGDFAHLPAADLLIAKDVLQHWSNRAIAELLPHLSRFRFCLITNCVNAGGPTENRDIADGEFRPLDLRLPPFAVKAAEVYGFSNARPFWARFFGRPRWTKKVLLLENPG